jgi:hypothetical protein
MKLSLRSFVLHNGNHRLFHSWRQHWLDLDKVDEFAAHLGQGRFRSLDGGVLAFLFGLTALVVLGFNAG